MEKFARNWHVLMVQLVQVPVPYQYLSLKYQYQYLKTVLKYR